MNKLKKALPICPLNVLRGSAMKVDEICPDYLEVLKKAEVDLKHEMSSKFSRDLGAIREIHKALCGSSAFPIEDCIREIRGYDAIGATFLALRGTKFLPVAVKFFLEEYGTDPLCLGIWSDHLVTIAEAVKMKEQIEFILNNPHQ